MSKKKLYVECYSGISGDMFVASLLDLGADLEVLEKSLKSLESIKDKFEIKTSRVVKSGLDALDFSVVLDVDNHDHDMDIYILIIINTVMTTVTTTIIIMNTVMTTIIITIMTIVTTTTIIMTMNTVIITDIVTTMGTVMNTLDL